MNYYEHHIGDYDKNTSHLTACEDGIYSRLIRRYYDKEVPLPADVEKVKRYARARDDQERAAVEAVLEEFFVLEADGWHHKVCDEAIAKFKAGEPEREAKKRNEDTRSARYRAERSALFALINAAGQHFPWNTHISILREAVFKIKAEPSTQPATAPVTQPATPATEPATQPATIATAPVTPSTATQSPVPSPHPPTTNALDKGGEGEPPAAPPPAPTPAPVPVLAYDPATGKTARPQKRCPPDFEVTAGMVTWLEANCPLLAQNTVLLERENQRFRDTEFNKSPKVDWRATWRSWMADKETKLEDRARIDRRHVSGHQETAGHRQAREAVETLTGGRASAKRPGSDGPPPGHPATLPFIDEEPRHVASRPATRLLR